MTQSASVGEEAKQHTTCFMTANKRKNTTKGPHHEEWRHMAPE